MSALVGHEDLATWLGYAPGQKLRIRRALDRRGVAYTLGKDGRVCTTSAAIDQAIASPARARKEITFA